MAADRPLPTGGRVVVTRSLAENRPLVAELRELGFYPIEIPLVEVMAPVDGGVDLRRAMEHLGDYRWVVLTSVNGVRAVQQARGRADWPPGVTVVPVGPTTEAAARALGMTVDPPPPIATAESLVEAFPVWNGSGGRRVLAPLAELAGSTVTNGLSAKGYRVDRVVAYRTEAPGERHGRSVADQRLRAQSADAVTFFSPSVVDRFVHRFGDAAVPPVVICIGPSTANRAADRGLSGIVTARPHTQAGVVAAVRTALG